MRLVCPHCQYKFDVAHRKVLAEADRLKGAVSAPRTTEAQAGNVLDPNDEEAARQRAEAIARRLGRTQAESR